MKNEYFYEKEDAIKKLTKDIMNIVQDNKNKEIVIVNIGTDRHIGDSIAPMVGTILTENNVNVQVYGTLENPIHALNLVKNLEDIKHNHLNSIIIAIDACLGDNVGTIILSDVSISPGKGAGKDLPLVGDYSIKIIIDGGDNFFNKDSIKMGFILKLARFVSKALMNCFNTYDDYEVALCKIN